MLSSEEISIYLNRTRVGLILSQLEGANYASIQYLLCGLPIVTTRNQGGRDAFFSPEYVIWADDTPESVAQAVDALISRDLDPMVVREATLERIRAHRAVFIREVESAFTSQPNRPAFTPDWPTFFSNKLLRKFTPLEPGVLGFKARLELCMRRNRSART